ncbi:MAG: hypothetical protein ABIG94_11055, partial [Pseudomonadota bacterium]
DHSLGLKVDGSLYAWGRNAYGQLGIGNKINQNTPTPVAGAGWVAVAAGSYHSLGRRADGALYAWGYNNYGQLGLGDIAKRKTPTRVPFPGALPWIHLLLLGN